MTSFAFRVHTEARGAKHNNTCSEISHHGEPGQLGNTCACPSFNAENKLSASTCDAKKLETTTPSSRLRRHLEVYLPHHQPRAGCKNSRDTKALSGTRNTVTITDLSKLSVGSPKRDKARNRVVMNSHFKKLVSAHQRTNTPHRKTQDQKQNPTIHHGLGL